MADGQEIIDFATLRLGRRPAGTAFSSHDASMNTELFTVLQDLISRLNEKNLLQIPRPSATTDTLDLYPGQLQPLKWMMTEQCMSPLRVSRVSPEVAKNIEGAEDDLAMYANIDIALDLSEYSGGHRYNIDSDR